jgi:hypothetical protein
MAFTSGQQDGTTSTTTPTSTLITAVGPNNIPLTLQYVNGGGWPKDFKLDLELGNWTDWSLQMRLLAQQQGFLKYLTGSFTKPPLDTHPRANYIWGSNDESLRGFILARISRADYRAISHLTTSHETFEELWKTHEKQGLHAQVVLIKQVLEIRSSLGTALLKTADEIDALFN